jgi:hypothetical protein
MDGRDTPGHDDRMGTWAHVNEELYITKYFIHKAVIDFKGHTS